MYLASFAKDQVCFDSLKLWKKPSQNGSFSGEGYAPNARLTAKDVPTISVRRERNYGSLHSSQQCYRTSLPVENVPVHLFAAVVEKSRWRKISTSPHTYKDEEHRESIPSTFRSGLNRHKSARVRLQRSDDNNNNAARIRYLWLMPKERRENEREIRLESRVSSHSVLVSSHIEAIDNRLDHVDHDNLCSKHLPIRTKRRSARQGRVIFRQPCATVFDDTANWCQKHTFQESDSRYKRHLYSPSGSRCDFSDSHHRPIEIPLSEIPSGGRSLFSDGWEDACNRCFGVMRKKRAPEDVSTYDQGNSVTRSRFLAPWKLTDDCSDDEDEAGSDTDNGDDNESVVNVYAESDIDEVSDVEDSGGSESGDSHSTVDNSGGDEDMGDSADCEYESCSSDAEMSYGSSDMSAYRDEVMEQEEQDLLRNWMFGAGEDGSCSDYSDHHSCGDSEEILCLNSDDGSMYRAYGLQDDY